MPGTVSPGDLIQLDPLKHTHHEGFWAGRVLVVDDVKSWGVECHAPLKDAEAHYRARNGTFVRVGSLHWLPE